LVCWALCYHLAQVSTPVRYQPRYDAPTLAVKAISGWSTAQRTNVSPGRPGHFSTVGPDREWQASASWFLSRVYRIASRLHEQRIVRPSEFPRRNSDDNSRRCAELVVLQVRARAARQSRRGFARRLHVPLSHLSIPLQIELRRTPQRGANLESTSSNYA